ncbi:MAG: ABC transporter substrate-binding protein [Planctomycetaceae bacterium]|jgi:iron complex transport system substrate-binding protein|nr:ABC transporter substrate-binding protein [Planctomycetaceae bacterium]
MMKKFRIFLFILLQILFSGCFRQHSTVTPLEPIRTLEQLESYRQQGLVPKKIERIFCSGGTLRLAVYLESADKVVAVDTNERREKGRNGMKAYLVAHPEFCNMPIGGETSGRDNPETLLSLKNQPQLIIKADTNAGYDPAELTRRTGIPVLLVPMRGITVGRKDFDAGLRLMGAALGKSERAEAVLEFFDREMTDIKLRTQKDEASGRSKPLAYVGGVSYNGSHAFHSTEAGYPPFVIAEVNTPVKENENEPTLGKRHTMLAKEKILEWNPDILFLDLGTLYLGEASGLIELQNDPAYRSLKAVKAGNVYSLLPNTFYFVNHDAVLINAWFVGKILYPEQFKDIVPKKKADEIFTFLVGKPVFELLNAELDHLALEKLEMLK